MSVLRNFNEIFGLEGNIQEEKTKFVQRIDQTIFEKVEALSYPITYKTIFQFLCYAFGVNTTDRISSANSMNYDPYREYIPPIKNLTTNDFLKTLKVLVLLHSYFKNDYSQGSSEMVENINNIITQTLEISEVDVGIEWRDGMFFPKGAENLDEELLHNPLKWLSDFPDEKKNFTEAIQALLKKDYKSVISKCYLTIEGLARKILGNNKTLENNKEEILKKLNLSNSWAKIFSNFIQYAHDHARHASDNQHNISPEEVEAFLYLTGLMVRLAVIKK